MTYEMKIPHLRKLQASFRRAPELTMRAVTRAVDKSLIMLQGEAKYRAPVDTGLLRSSILIRPATRTGDSVEGSVGTPLKHAIYQEQGTGIYGPARRPIRPRRANMLAWKKHGQWHFARQVRGVRGRFYLKKSLSANRRWISIFFKGALEEVAEELGD